MGIAWFDSEGTGETQTVHCRPIPIWSSPQPCWMVQAVAAERFALPLVIPPQQLIFKEQ